MSSYLLQFIVAILLLSINPINSQPSTLTVINLGIDLPSTRFCDHCLVAFYNDSLIVINEANVTRGNVSSYIWQPLTVTINPPYDTSINQFIFNGQSFLQHNNLIYAVHNGNTELLIFNLDSMDYEPSATYQSFTNFTTPVLQIHTQRCMCYNME